MEGSGTNSGYLHSPVSLVHFHGVTHKAFFSIHCDPHKNCPKTFECMDRAHSVCAKLFSPPVASKPISSSPSLRLSNFKAFDLWSGRFLPTTEKSTLLLLLWPSRKRVNEYHLLSAGYKRALLNPRERHWDSSHIPCFIYKQMQSRGITPSKICAFFVFNEETLGWGGSSFLFRKAGFLLLSLLSNYLWNSQTC